MWLTAAFQFRDPPGQVGDLASKFLQPNPAKRGRKLGQVFFCSTSKAIEAHHIPSFQVCEGDCDLNQPLIKRPIRLVAFSPDFFPHFVCLEKLSLVEEFHSLPKETLGIHRLLSLQTLSGVIIRI